MQRAFASLGIASLVVLATAIAVLASGGSSDEHRASPVASLSVRADFQAEASTGDGELDAADDRREARRERERERPARTRPPRDHATAEDRERSRPDRVERLRLACRGFEHEGDAGVGCRWSVARHPALAGYELWRGEREAGRSVVFRTQDRSETAYLDRDVTAGRAYVYVVRALDAEGNVIGRSDPVRVRAGGTASDDPATLLPR